MSDGKKPSIPAWQRAKPASTPPADDPVYSQPESNAIETGDSLKEVEIESQPTESPSEQSEPEIVPADTTSPTTEPHPAAIPPRSATFSKDDFSTYQAQQSQSQPRQIAQQPAPQQRPPPIITYPEFLLSAHKPPPLITPSRVITTIYAATGISALLYGASRWLVTPMVQSLSASRHELLTHSTSKVDEFNEKLSKIVSQIPVPPPKEGEAKEAEDDSSVDSDPTELYHRDMGTQTSDLPTNPAPPQKSPADRETSILNIIESHFAELSDSSDRVAEANKDRQLTINKFRHLLDGMVYNMDGLPTWEAGSDGAMMMKAPGQGKGDMVEELKKEIRGVKGVLLSARRFPSTPGRVASTVAS
ncbi:uncharacterized protein RCC_03987 [Ramularia collo-cygni]|uniref:Uncharacterized protein n=1 Tax=Ramularia collo-cygni TaxID=112498 RepID=A0A2D3V0F6_9PEZI|nr:uncharacterized protein RCC_03987 [Ramularia collo-cygni]CZT18147.1 uncharacterized protein RCC_03987 [Ramularia collo-cygni]